MTNQVIGVTIKGIGDFSDVVSNVGNVQKALTKLKLPDKLGDNLNKNISNFMKEYDKYQKKIAEGIHTKGDQNAVNKSLNSMLNSYEKIIKDFSKISEKDFKDVFNLDTGDFKKFQQQLRAIEADIKKIKLDPKALIEPINKIKELTSAKRLFGNGTGFDKLTEAFKANDFLKAKEAIQEIDGYLARFGSKMKPEKLQDFQNAWGPLKAKILDADAGAEDLYKDFDRVNQVMANLGNQGSRELQDMANGLRNTDEAAKSVVAELKQLHANEFDFNRQAADIDRQIQSYFGLSQMIRKVGDIAKDAFSTVKELDKAMTQTAVVTNFSVGDMWDMLPTYTAQANQLGSTIKDVYEAATLYYQQGLNTNQAMGLANETLKMARIAGLDAAEATNMMTAALRGFNMEINQMSAQKVNDIYSELAAITASDTKEIGSAMERTASIANSANMDFATTSAFLAQMIETTREAPENLGTAMKTIVARFQEMKQDPTKLIDSEGVAMDANKVDKALKTIGVNLMNTKGEFRDLDDVFLDIASKWDSLSQGQQRYIATIAAGSRQQSRFIAMMSDYERTMELVDAANNSAGASQRQFEKTLDSMEAKLNMLKNAWDQFTMGLMNNQILKFGVDRLTDAFTIVNKFIDILGSIPPNPFEGITKSVLTLVTTLGMLNFGKKASRGLILGGAGWWKGETSFAGGFSQGWKQSGQTGFFANRKNNVAAAQGKADAAAYNAAVQNEMAKGGFTKAIAMAWKTKGQNFDFTNTFGAAFGQFNGERFAASWSTDIEAEITRVLNSVIKDSAKIGEVAGKEFKQNLIAQLKAGNISGEQLISSVHQVSGEDISNLGVNAKQFKDGAEAATNFGTKISLAGDSLLRFGVVLQGTPLAPFGSMLSTVGMAVSNFGSAFAKAATIFTNGMNMVVQSEITGSLATAGLAGGFKALWGALLESPLFPIVAALLALYGTYKLLDAAIVSNKEQLEAATDAAAAASEAYDSAKQETSELADAIDTIRETDSAFDGLVAGTAEFNEQLVTANEQIMALIDKYPMLNDSQYLSTDKNGLMHINEAGFKAVKEYQKQIQARASAMNLIQTADLNALENQQKAQQLRNSIKTNMSDDEQERILRNADILEQRAEAETKLAHLNAIRTNLVDKEIADQEKLASIYVDQYEAKKQVAEAEVEAMGKHDIRQAYADYHGYTYDKSTKKIKDVEGNEIDYDDAAIKDEVIEQTVMLDFEANASSLEGVLHSLDRDFSKTLDGAFENSSSFISDVLSNNIEANEDLLQQVLDNPKQLNDFIEGLSTKELAAVLGVSEEAVESNVSSYKQQLEDKLLTNAQNIIDTNAQANGELAAMLAQAQGKSANEVLISKNTQEGLIQQVKNFTAEQRNTLLNIGKTLEESAGSEAMATFVNGLSNIYQTGSEELKTATQDWVDGVNWETATGRLKGYNEAINMTADDTEHLGEEGVKQINDLGKALLESQNEANLLGEAFEEFYNSTDFQEMAENMDKFVDSSGQLNAASVMDMAEECHSLNNLLDTGAISAGGVAAALNALGSSGDLVLSDLNSRVLELLSNFGQLDDIIASSHRNIENFDWGIDTGEAEDFVKESAEKWNELYKNGEVGNPQMEAYAKWVMGEDKYIALLADKNGDLQETMAEVSKYVNKYSEGFTEAWDDLASGKWEIDEKDLSDNLKNLGISASFNDDGSWHWEPGKATTAELQQWLQEVKGIGPELAQAMIEDWSNYSPNFRAERQKNDFNAGLDSYVEQRRGANGEVAITASELNTIVASTGQKEDEVIAAIAEQAGIDTKQVEILENINKNTGEYVTDGAVLNKELTEAVGARGQNGWLAAYQARDSAGNLMSNTIDIESAMAAAVERGYTAAQAKSMAYESYTNAAQQGKDYYYKGELLEADQYKTLDQFAARLEEIDQNEQWTTVGQAMADGFLNRMEALNKPEESALTGGKSEEPLTSNIPKGTTIPGVGYVESGSTSSTSPYNQAEKDLYSRNSKILSQWWSDFWKGSTPEGHTELTPQQKQKMYGGDESAKDSKDGQTVDAATGLKDAGSKLQEGSTQIVNAASKLEGAASKLDSAANTLQNNNNTNNSIPKGTTIPGVGFVESSTQTTDVNYEVKVANGEEIRASVQEQLASILKSVTSITQQAQASASIKVNYAKGKQAKASNQSAKVNYKKGTQDKAEDKEAKVNYVKGSQALPDSPKTATVNYSIGSQEDPKDKTAYVTYKRKPGTLDPDKQATGSHNHGYVQAPSFGSAAKGYGQVGPKGKGGLTLTGELGYEIAWLPSENRSMILGANGPQMVNLPGDAVVWTHEQSKKILKQKAIPAGSHSDRPRPGSTNSGGGSGGGSGGSSGKDSSSGNNNNSNNIKEQEKLIKKAGKVTVWWENQARKVDAIQRKADKALNGFKTLIGNGNMTLKEIKETIGKDYIKNLQASTTRSQESYNRASAELNLLDKGSGKGKATTTYKTVKKGSKNKTGVKTLQEDLIKAGYGKGLKADGKFGNQTVEALKKFQKKKGLEATGKADKKTIQKLSELGYSTKGLKSTKYSGKKLIENGGSWANISYQLTKKTTKKGKTKTSKETKESKVDLSKYIKEKDGTYVIDQAKLDDVGKTHIKTPKTSKGKKKLAAAQETLKNKKATKKEKEAAQKVVDKYTVKGNKSKAEAIKNAAESEINKRLDRQKKAEDDMIKNREAEIDYYNQIEDAFHGWKNELDRVAAVTNEIAKTEARINVLKSQGDLAKTTIEALDLSGGLNSIGEKLNTELGNIAINYINQGQELENKKTQNKEAQNANEAALQNALTLTEYEKKAAANARVAEKGQIIGSTKVYDALSEVEKNAYAKDILLKEYLKTNDDGTHSFNWADLEKAIANEEITGELGGRLKAAWDEIEAGELKAIELQGEEYSIEAEKIQLTEEEKEYYKDIASQLFSWENSLTKILQLTMQIEQAEKRTSILKSGVDYYSAKVEAGFGGSENIAEIFGQQIKSTFDTIKERSSLIDENKKELQDIMSGANLQKEAARISQLQANGTLDANVANAQLEELAEEAHIVDLAKQFTTMTTNADGTVTATLKSDELDAAIGTQFDAATGQKIADYVASINEKSGEIQDLTEKNITDSAGMYTELVSMRQTYADKAKELREAYIEQQQKQIDQVKALYSAIDAAFNKLINQVRQSLSERRQQEDNAKTEQDISKKQQRLASLRADTSGGHQVEIAQLQQEINDAQQAYGRTLEDQMLDKISQQGDQAAQQRQQQINLLQGQHDIAKNTGLYAQQINEWLNDPTKYQENIKGVLTQRENWSQLTAAEQEVLTSTLNTSISALTSLPGQIDILKTALVGAEGSSTLSTVENSIANTGTSIDTAKTDLTTAISNLPAQLAEQIKNLQVTPTVENKDENEKNGGASSNSGGSSSNGGSESSNTSSGTQNATNTTVEENENERKYYDFLVARGNATNTGDKYWGKIGKDGINNMIKWGAAIGKDKKQVLLDLVNTDALNWEKIVTAAKKAGWTTDDFKAIRNGLSKNSSKNSLGKVVNKVYGLPKGQKFKTNFKTGGVADFTGPAWLDGTPSKPELVLNARDTQNFLALREILDKVMNATGSITNSYGGDAMYEININVDHLSNDYDVDRVVEKVKKEIVKGSGYRNVTQVRNLR